MSNKLAFKKNLTALIVAALVMQSVSLFAFGQSLKNAKSRVVTESVQSDAADLAPQNKIAPDLQESIDNVARGFQGDQTQRVIIQLKPFTEINNIFGDEVSRDVKEQMLAEEVRANKSRALSVRSRLQSLNGQFKQSYSRLGLVTAELPSSRVRELIQDENIAYVSPDRATQATGHVELTTGASLVRSLLGGTTTVDGTGIGIAIIDSGVEKSHVDLSSGPLSTSPSRVVYSKSFITGNAVTSDMQGHGTHVAGLAAGSNVQWGSTPHYRGVAPGAKIVNLRVLDNLGKGTSSNVIAAIDWTIANKATYNIRVINLSLGTGPKDSYLNDPLCQAARRAFNAGIVVVASAGNYGKDINGIKVYGGIGSPGIEPSVITVGASNTYGTDGRSDDTITTYSSRGPTRGYRTLTNGARKYDNLIKPDLVAPGNKLISTESLGTAYPDPSSGWVYYRNNLVNDYPTLQVTGYVDSGGGPNMHGYQYCSGTSMAAPVVTGAVALMLQVRPNLTPSLVKAILMYSAQPLYGFNTLEQGAGELNVDGAVRIAKLVNTTLPTTNGSALLSAALPNPQASMIAGQTCNWGKGVITNFGFLYGDDLMNKWQGMYGNGVLINDGTPFANGVLTKSSTKTSGTLSLYQGAISNNGVLVSDGVLYLSANAMGSSPTPFVNSQGVLVSDGVLINDGVLVGDGVLVSDGGANALAVWLGDNTTSMLPAP